MDLVINFVEDNIQLPPLKIENFDMTGYFDTVKKSREFDMQAIVKVGHYNAIICDNIINHYSSLKGLDIISVVL